MRKNEYIEMLLAENTEGSNQKVFADVIDCVDIALSQEPESFEVDSSVGLEELFKIVEQEGRKRKGSASHSCVGPFEAAELFAQRFGARYVRRSRRPAPAPVRLEDFI